MLYVICCRFDILLAVGATLGEYWQDFGGTWADFGAILGYVGAILGPLWDVLGVFGHTLGLGFWVWGLITTAHTPLEMLKSLSTYACAAKTLA